jgi:hypothetical protein
MDPPKREMGTNEELLGFWVPNKALICGTCTHMSRKWRRRREEQIGTPKNLPLLTFNGPSYWWIRQCNTKSNPIALRKNKDSCHAGTARPSKSLVCFKFFFEEERQRERSFCRLWWYWYFCVFSSEDWGPQKQPLDYIGR